MQERAERLLRFRDTLVERAEQVIALLSQETGKPRPEAARAKILAGKLDKWMAEKCLEEQSSVRDTDTGSIKDICDALSAKIGEKIAIRRFVRFELGEGIEKKKSDLAAEVAETLKSVS